MQKESRGKSALKSITVTALLTAFFSLSAYIHIPMTIPVTMQTFALSVCLVLMGTVRTLKMLLCYTAIGCVGLPVFSGFRAGVSVLFEPTGGYIIGFFVMTLFYGLLERCVPEFKFKNQIILLLSLLWLYLCSSIWYSAVYMQNTSGGFVQALLVCALPYVLPDVVKVIIACGVAKKLKKYISAYI